MSETIGHLSPFFTNHPASSAYRVTMSPHEWSWSRDEQIAMARALVQIDALRAVWSKNLPDESGLWWWWNGDPDGLPIVVDIAYSGTSNSYFAMQGQHGWNRYQDVKEMGGWWMRLHEPAVPEI